MPRRYRTKKKTTTKEGKREYQKHYMRDRRSREAQLRDQLKRDIVMFEQLKKIPSAYELIFGKQRRKR